ncbi:hypothetical protein F4813DRAFT_390326 [Daldinia decipiens]|uniref:uncharacterized protein n=1 Tax=Daldinia decipiens TaxID=326647 RepID=UPI0020C2A928|nr:uncharacterized protein F4813DRAFT_390326 [Daldinia decipiens]KAI1656985.1 hypothetical protein F4813DRAFT_390326 [Daldinia decipiens]
MAMIDSGLGFLHILTGVEGSLCWGLRPTLEADSDSNCFYRAIKGAQGADAFIKLYNILKEDTPQKSQEILSKPKDIYEDVQTADGVVDMETIREFATKNAIYL